MEDAVWKAVQEQCPDAHQVDLLIALPSFNYASTIESVLKAILAGLNASFAGASILIVNADVGSQDGTPEIVKQTVGDLFPVALIQPLGEGSSASPFALNRLSYSGMPGERRPSDPFLC